MVLKLGHFGKYIRSTLTVLKCGAGTGWRRSVEPIVWDMEKCQAGDEYPADNKKDEG
jgi:hypothetical protein